MSPLAGILYSELSFYVRTFGCQMNAHDSERIIGMLESKGMIQASSPEEADIVVFLTCCVRESANTREIGQVASLKNTPSPHGKRIIALGGCIGQQLGQTLREEYKHIDIVFGTHTLNNLLELIDEVKETNKPLVYLKDSTDEFTTSLPTHRANSWHAWLPIMCGCNNFCTYCIVPYVRGREKSRPLDAIQADLASLKSEHVREVTLLGQNVNSYGRDLYGESRFPEILRMAAESGIERVRFATSHPKDISDKTIAAFADCETVMPYLHLPFQSGSNKILKAMNRHYTREYYLDVIRRVRDAVPDIALSTDIIVGFPGETEADFLDTLNLVKEVGYDQAFTFIFSPREGTPAAKMSDDTSRPVIQDRFDRLVSVVQSQAEAANKQELGTVQQVLIEGPSKRDQNMITGRTPKNRPVHAPLPASFKGTMDDLIGTFATVKVTDAKTWFLSGEIIDMECGRS